MGADTVEKLEIWRDGIELVKTVYLLTGNWPKDERYGLTAQVRRAAVSIPANLAEGVGRGSSAEIIRFARISLGSLYELDTLLHIASQLGFSSPESVSAIRQSLSSLARRISAFVRYQHHRS